jgi:DNA-binding NarL/FixJ family response regulator
MHDESLYAERALRAGARGYVTKQQLDDTVLIAIRRVLNGEMYLSEKIGARFTEKFLGGRTLETDSPLIAQRLHLSIKTIESHREHIKQKLALESGAALVRRAIHWVETGRTS